MRGSSSRHGREERHGIEVALDGLRRADPCAVGLDGHSPVHADHVAAARGDLFDVRRGAGAEVDHGDTGGLHRGEQLPVPRLHVAQ